MNSDIPAETPPSSEWLTGWPIVLAATLGYGCSIGLFAMSAGLFITPMRAEFGWPMSAVAFVPVVTLISAMMMPLGGVAIDRFGSRPVAMFGVILFAASYIALAILPMSLPVLYTVAAILGLLSPAGSPGPYVRGVATWFRRQTGSAFGVTLSGTSVGGVFIVPIIALVIDRYGWRSGYLAMSAILLIVVLPLVALLFREKTAHPTEKENVRATSGQSWRETLVDIRFWLLLLSLGLAALPMGAFGAHLQPLLLSKHFSIPVAAGFGSLFALSIGVGRVVGGMLIDRFWDFGVIATALILGAAGCFTTAFVDAGTSYWFVAMAVAAIGLTYGAEVDFGAYLSLKMFGLKDFAKIFGVKSLVVGSGVALGGILSSALFDLAGNYGPLGLVTGALFAMSAAIMLMMGFRERRLTVRTTTG